MFGNYAVIVSTEFIDPEHVEAASVYINTLMKNDKHKKDTVVRVPPPDGDICTAEMLADIIQNKYLCGAVSTSTYNYYSHK